MGSGVSPNGKGSGGGKKVAVPEFKEIKNAKSFGDVSKTQLKLKGSKEYKELMAQTKTPEWEKSMTSSESKAVTWYTGSAFWDLNQKLREVSDEPLTPTQKKNVALMDAALAKTELTEPLAVYRGSGPELLGGASTVGEIKKLIGATVTDSGFVSSSVSKAGSFSEPIAYKIIVPAGKGHGGYVNNISQHQSEMEFLMPRNSSFRITDVKKLGNKPCVIMQMVTND